MFHPFLFAGNPKKYRVLQTIKKIGIDQDRNFVTIGFTDFQCGSSDFGFVTFYECITP